MSYIRAMKVDQRDSVLDYGFALNDISFEDRPDIDNDLNDEMAKFITSLIAAVDNLAEGEALVVWKEIF